ncbi:MAG: PorV/PorQ family protein [Candidatus Poribacteria bacterium]|nr:PorV/PorQ family protein [Candidatus Poribacteria bacterium]
MVIRGAATVVAFGSIWLSNAQAAEIHADAGTSAFSSLKIGVGAETIGMGEAGVALVDDAYATYWNVAGLAYARQTEIALMNNEWLLDIRQNYIAVAQPIGDSATAAGFVSYFDYGEMQGYNSDGGETGVFRPFDLSAGLGFGLKVGGSVAVGAQAKILRQEIDDSNASGFGVDLGARYDVPDSPLSFGASVQHLGSSLKFESESYSLPMTVRVGAGYRVLEDRASVALDAVIPSDNDPVIGTGFSYAVFNELILRGGYRLQLGGSDLGAVSGLTAGFGLNFEGFHVDYAYVPYGYLGPTNRVSVSASF